MAEVYEKFEYETRDLTLSSKAVNPVRSDLCSYLKSSEFEYYKVVSHKPTYFCYNTIHEAAGKGGVQRACRPTAPFTAMGILRNNTKQN